MKRFSMQYTSDQVVCGSNRHTWGYASTLKTAKQYIKRCREEDADNNPHDFMVYDHEADVNPATGYVPCVYSED